MGRKLIVIALVLGLVAGACGDDDGGDDTAGDQTGDAATTTAGADASADTTQDAADTTVTTEDAGGCSTDIEIVNADAAELDGLTDGPVDVAVVLADKGPHPANTVDYDTALDLAISGFEIEEDPQFGLTIPVGTPDVPDATFFATVSLFNPAGPIAAGQTYIDQLEYDDDPSAADGEINFYAAYWGSERLLPGNLTLTITEITDEQVCGTVESATDTDLQTFVGIEGTFAADRIQALES